MTEEISLSLDYTGMKCPRPIIELARQFDLAQQVDTVPVGSLVEVLADDPAAAPDLAAWCRMRDQELVTSEPPRFLIRRVH